MKTCKLIVGVLGICASALIALEAFAFWLLPTTFGGLLSGLGLKTGSVLLAAMLIGSVFAIASGRNKFGGAVAGILFLICAAAAFYKTAEYPGALLWGCAGLVFGVLTLLVCVKSKKPAGQEAAAAAKL